MPLRLSYEVGKIIIHKKRGVLTPLFYWQFIKYIILYLNKKMRGVMTEIQKSINYFYNLLKQFESIKILSSDLKLIALKEFKILISKINYSDDLQNELEDSLTLLKNHNEIFDYKRLENGFKIYPQNKIYFNENDLVVKFNIDK